MSSMVMCWLTLNAGDPLRELLDPEQIFEHILTGLVRLPLALVVMLLLLSHFPQSDHFPEAFSADV